ncbi:hypothetical protein KSP39_PZI011921 [Platanthera zijinensis]|uniref:RRM domain-containing protein n=1 Tax=Platanthera zijinensis TaxID=2320716 RepID=A0AAP0BFB2_9ASPA
MTSSIACCYSTTAYGCALLLLLGSLAPPHRYFTAHTAMSASESSSTSTSPKNLLFMCSEPEYTGDVPMEMRDNYYFCLLLSNLIVCTSTAVLKSIFGSLPGFIHTTVDVDTRGQPLGTGEVIFADALTMHEAATTMDSCVIDGTTISVREMTLYDIRPEFFFGGAERMTSRMEVDNNVDSHIPAPRPSVPDNHPVHHLRAECLPMVDEQREFQQLYNYSDASVRNMHTAEADRAAQRASNRERSQRRRSLMSIE